MAVQQGRSEPLSDARTPLDFFSILLGEGKQREEVLRHVWK
jgi:hypothetical protein